VQTRYFVEHRPVLEEHQSAWSKNCDYGIHGPHYNKGVVVRAANCPVKQMMLGKMPMGIVVHLST
jgi:hypothetical protein